MTIKKAKRLLYDKIMLLFSIKSENAPNEELSDDYIREVGSYYNDFEIIMELKKFSCEECLDYCVRKIYSIQP